MEASKPAIKQWDTPESTRIPYESSLPACDSWEFYLHNKLFWTNIKLGECQERVKKLEEKMEWIDSHSGLEK